MPVGRKLRSTAFNILFFDHQKGEGGAEKSINEAKPKKL
jgi:hypothetical protein